MLSPSELMINDNTHPRVIASIVAKLCTKPPCETFHYSAYIGDHHEVSEIACLYGNVIPTVADERDDYGANAYWYACLGGNETSARLLGSIHQVSNASVSTFIPCVSIIYALALINNTNGVCIAKTSGAVFGLTTKIERRMWCFILHRAISNDDSMMVACLLDGVDKYPIDDDEGMCPLVAAITVKNADVIRSLLKISAPLRIGDVCPCGQLEPLGFDVFVNDDIVHYTWASDYARDVGLVGVFEQILAAEMSHGRIQPIESRIPVYTHSPTKYTHSDQE